MTPEHKTKYELLGYFFVHELELAVNKHLAEGWTLHGPTTSLPNEKYLIQAMIKTELDQPDDQNTINLTKAEIKLISWWWEYYVGCNSPNAEEENLSRKLGFLEEPRP